MKKEFVFLRELAARLGLVMLLFSLVRLIFLTANRRFFPTAEPLELASYFFYGLRFDASSVLWVNSLFVVLSLAPFRFRMRSGYQMCLKNLFWLSNMPVLALELADVAWFPFNIRRTIFSDFQLLLNTPNLWGKFLLENWWLVVVLGGLVWTLSIGFERTRFSQNLERRWSVGGQLLIFVLGLSVWVVGVRGGLQLKPIMPINASVYVRDARWSPLLSNATMNLLASVQQKFIEEKTWLTDAELDAEFPLLKKYDHAPADFRPLNVVTIALESFGTEVRQAGWAPFLDSLEKRSFVPQKSYANGLRSIQGNASMVASIPALMTDPWLISPYQNNQIEGLGGILRQKGYATAVFHGSKTGSMQLDKLASQAGYSQNFDRWSFADQSMFDGLWGIYDRPFFQFFKEKLDAMPQPFCCHFFNLSCHHPFNVESSWAERFPKMNPHERAARYADDALRQFFAAASKEKWFENTLFVLAADHTGPSHKPEFQTFEGKFRVPILFFCPRFLPAAQPDLLISQVDILPSVLDFLGFSEPFSSFGESIFSTKSGEPHYAYMFEGGVFQILDGHFLLLFDGKGATGLFDYVADPFSSKNLLAEKPTEAARLERRLRAIIERHHRAMIRNQLVATQKRQ